MSPFTVFAGPYGLLAKWAVIALLAAALFGKGYMAGIERESDRRDAIELKQVNIEHESYAKAAAYGVEQAKRARAADARADEYHQNWKEARDAARRAGTPLAVEDCGAAVSGPAPAGSGLANPAVPLRLRLTWELVGLWDSAYTASDGQPVFGDTAGTEKAAAGSGAASPYTVDDLLDLHGENAKRWDICRRQLTALIQTIDGLERKWNEQHQSMLSLRGTGQ